MPSIILKKSSVAAKTPLVTDLAYGELALNYADGKLYYKTASNTISYFTTGAAQGTVTSVAGAGTVSGLTLTGTVTSSGSLTLGGTLSVTASNFASQTANTVLAAPNGAAGIPTFRTLVAADIPTLNQNTTGSANRIAFLDTRAVDDLPNAKASNALSADFKNTTAVGSPPIAAGNGYAHIITVNGWDSGGSGGWVSQLSVANGIAVRQATSGTVWGAWKTMLDSSNYSSYALPLSGGTLTGNVSTSGTVTATNGLIGRLYGAAAGAPDSWIWSVSPANPTWGMYYNEDTPDAIEFRAADAVKASIFLDTGAATFASTVTAPTFSGALSGNATTATTLQTARNINGTAFSGGADISTTEWFHSGRDFPNGTLITTDIIYSQTNGDPFVVEIRGNSYGNIIPLDLVYQGYIYSDTIISHGGISNGYSISGLVAINVNGVLCFWFPSQGYWQGYNVKVYVPNVTRAVNRVTSITGVAKPTSTKEVALSVNIRQSLHSGNYTSYSPSLTGSGASGSWGISVTGSAGSVAWSGITSKPTTLSGYGITDAVATTTTGLSIDISSTDLNAKTTTGFYRGSSLTNAPDAGWWYVIVEAHDNAASGWAKQTVTAYGASNSSPAGTTYTRVRTGGSTWSAWIKEIDASNYNSYAPSLTGSGASGNWAINITGSAGSVSGGAVSASSVYNSGMWYTFPEANRDANSAVWSPSAVTRGVAYFFGLASSVGTGGNYAGVMQFNPWIGTTASTGDASYQLAFGSTAANGGGTPQLRIRKGIDTTWNSWYDLLTSANYNSYSPTLTGTGASGSWGINITGSAATLNSKASSAFHQRVHYGTQNVQSSGYYKINIIPATSWMLSFTIRIYQGYESYDIRVSGYNYGGNYWFRPAASLMDSGAASIDVRFGYDSANNLWVAVPAGNYTGLDILNVVNGYTQFDGNYADQFTIAYQATLTGTVQTTVTAYRPVKYNEALRTDNYTSYSPTLTGTGASGTWGISVTGSAATIAVANDTTTDATMYPLWVTGTSSGTAAKISSSKISFNPSTGVLTVASITGNAATATTLQTARTINGVSFNGSANITVADSTKLPLAGGTMTGTLVVTTGNGNGVKLGSNGDSLFGTTGDGASSTTANVKLTSWYGIGFGPSISGQTVPQWENACWIDARIGTFSARSNITAYASDIRLKRNFTSISNPLDKIRKVGGYEFDWDVDLCNSLGFSPSNTHEHGLKAQEILEIMPDAVALAPFDDNGAGTSKSGNDYLTVRYEKVVPLLVEAIKAQDLQVTCLQDKIAHLEALVAQLIHKG